MPRSDRSLRGILYLLYFLKPATAMYFAGEQRSQSFTSEPPADRTCGASL